VHPTPHEGIRAAAGGKLSRSMHTLMGTAIRPLMSRAATVRAPNPSGRRFCILHLDGVSRDTLLLAIRRGYAPFLGRLMRSGAYKLTPCWSGAPASTPAFQAGLLYGVRDPDIPGFLWYDRATRKEVRMDRADDAAAVEARLTGGGEKLLHGGSINFAVFSGGAEVNGFSMAGWAAERVNLISKGYDRWHLAAATVAHSFTAARIVERLAKETGSLLFDLMRQSALVGRLQHEPTFLLHRLELGVGAREAATWGAVLDIARGVPAIYTCFGDYDEIAHRRGPDSEAALAALWGIDRALARILAAGAAAPDMNYDFYVVADHGQVPTRPFEMATGTRLADYLVMARPSPDGIPRVPDEALRCLQRMRLAEKSSTFVPKSFRERTRLLAVELARSLGQCRRDAETLRMLDEIECVDAGDIAHVYLGHETRPLVLEEIAQRYPRVLEVATRCPAIGIVAVRGGRAGYAWFRGERIDLAEPAEVSRLRLGYGGRMAGEFIAKMLRIPSAGDLVVYGNGLEEGDVAFAWEFGSHAGIAREEVETFVLHAADVKYDFSRVQHGADLHEYFVSTYKQRAERPTATH